MDHKCGELKIDIGCGTLKEEGYLGLDVAEHSHADVIYNLKKGLPFCDSSATHIKAHSVLEHFDNDQFIGLMWEIWRVLKKPGGKVDILIPHGLSEVSVKDPTHKLHLSGNVWSYFKPGSTRQLQYHLPPFEIIENKREESTLTAILESKPMPEGYKQQCCVDCGRDMLFESLKEIEEK